MEKFIAYGINIILYILFFIGIFMVFGRYAEQFFAMARMKNRLKARKNALEKNGLLKMHLDRLVKTTVSEKMTWKGLVLLSGLIFAATIMVAMNNYTLINASLIATAFGLAPYLILRMKLETVRKKASFEGESFMNIFLSKYRISAFNMYMTIEAMIKDKNTPKLTGRLLVPVLLAMRETGNQRSLKKVASGFAYAVNTNWSRMVAYNIGVGAASGMNVAVSLEDILIQLREAKALSEERKRLNGESTKMVAFLVPFSYGATMIMATKVLDISAVQLIKNQFFTPTGFTLFTLGAFLFLLNLVFIEIVNNQRFDY